MGMNFATLNVLACAALIAVGSAAADPPTLAEHARSFLAALTEDERDEASWPFADSERLDIRYAPTNLDGLRHGDLDGVRYETGDALLAATLSGQGFGKLRAIRLLERDVRERESVLLRPLGLRDPGRYYWAFFGEPSSDRAWSFRYEGHHLSLHVTSVPGHAPASLPLFLGAEPRLVPAGLPSAGVAALGVEEQLARDLYSSLDEAQRTAATLPFKADRGHMIGQVRTLADPAPVGLARASMNTEQQAVLDSLLDHFAGFWNASIAAARRTEIDAARPGLHFAFVAAEDPPFSFYTRISGPGLLLEIDNTQGGDHVHAVWHRPGADFGADLLAAHLRREHGVVVAAR